jgi:hypothetical protein
VFGTQSRCRPRGTIELGIVRAKGDVERVVAGQLGLRTDDVDVEVRDDGAGYAVTSGPDVQAALARPAGTGRWVVLRVRSTMYEGCSIGHHREEWSAPLETALASARVRTRTQRPALAAPGRWRTFATERSVARPGGGKRIDLAVSNVALPDTFRARARSGRIAFGPVGPCAIRGDLRLSLVTREAESVEEVVRAAAPGASVTDGIALKTKAATLTATTARWGGVGDRWALVRVTATGRRLGERGCRADHRRLGFTGPLVAALEMLGGGAY